MSGPGFTCPPRSVFVEIEDGAGTLDCERVGYWVGICALPSGIPWNNIFRLIEEIRIYVYYFGVIYSVKLV
jgi:hypothetical protein